MLGHTLQADVALPEKTTFLGCLPAKAFVAVAMVISHAMSSSAHLICIKILPLCEWGTEIPAGTVHVPGRETLREGTPFLHLGQMWNLISMDFGV